MEWKPGIPCSWADGVAGPRNGPRTSPQGGQVSWNRRSPALLLLLVLRLPVAAQEQELAPVLTVLDFATAGISAAEARVFTDVLSTQIVRTGAYRLIDRERRETILEEIEFSYADGADEGYQLEIGRLLAASQVLVGSIERTNDGLSVLARRLEVSTGRPLGTAAGDYPSLEAMLDDAGRLVQLVLGAEARQRLLSARRLISAAKGDELEARRRHLARRVEETDYRRWLRVKGFEEHERGAAVEEKVDFLEEYLRQANSRGHAVDLSLSYSPYAVREAGKPDGSYRTLDGQLVGVTASWSFQFSNRLAAGASLCVAQQSHLARTFDAADTLLSERTEGQPLVFIGPLLILGDKTGDFALLLSTGLAGTFGLGPYLPLRAGVYSHGFYGGYLGQLALEGGYAVHGAEAGYSLFLGRRRSWPPAGVKR